MSRIDIMNIIGIRSFPVDHGVSIRFFTPLTLIVGINGSGKTTIIECLKYAATGIQPPNSKVGGAFVHDPKLTFEREVMAQIKLQFYNNQNARMVLTRSLQLTVNKLSRSLKALEGSLLIDRHNEKTVISSRVAELDQVMPRYLGVSQAVLDNIILCHQDESLWPMSEPSVLKKKFDEIFESQKYTKAIDNIKQIRKKQHQELEKFKIMEQHAKQDKERSEKTREKSEKLHVQIEALREECLDLQAKMDAAQERAATLWRDSEEYSEILGVLKGKMIEADSKQQSVMNLKVHVREVEESDEWLAQTLARFSATMAQYQEQKENKKEQQLEWEDEIKAFRGRLSSKLAEQGKYVQDKEEYERHVVRRRIGVGDAASRLQIRGYDDLTDDSLVEEFLFRIRKMEKEQKTSLERARVQADTEKQEVMSLINRLTERRAALQDQRETIKRQMSEYEQKATGFQRQVDSIDVDEGSRAVIESRLGDVKQEMQKIQTEIHGSNRDAKLRDAHSQLRSFEEDNARLRDELVQSTKHASEVARLAHLKQEIKEKQRSLDTLVNAHKVRIAQLVGTDWTPNNIERKHDSALAEASKELTVAEKTRDAAGLDLKQIQLEQKKLREETAQKTEQASKEEEKVKATINADIASYEDVLQTANENVEAARDEAKGLGGLIDYFNSCLRTFNASRPSCRTCQRAFKNADDPALTAAKNKIKALVDKAGKDVEDARLAEAEAAYLAVVEAGTSLTNWKRLTSEVIPKLERDLKALNQQKENVVAKLEAADKVVQQKQSARKELEAMTKNVTSIARHETEIAGFKRQVEEAVSEQSQQGNKKTHDDLENEIKALDDSKRKVQSRIANLTAEQTASTDRLHELQLAMSRLQTERHVIDAQFEKKTSLIARVEEYRTSNGKQQNTVDQIARDVQSLEPQISTAQAQYEDVVQRWNSRLSEMSRDASQLNETLNGLDLLNKQIISYVERGVDKQLTIVTQEIKSLRQDVEQAEKHQVQLGREISKLGEELRDSENTRRQYSDNLRYRQDTNALEQLREEIQELSARNAKTQRDKFLEESKKATKLYQKYSGEREGKLGEMKTKDNQLEELLQDFKTDLLDAPKRYREAHIKVETTKHAIADLQVFGTALDSAIMKFHSARMEQVNEIMAHLWQRTYKGSDVDRIMIRSDSQSASGGSGSASTAISVSSSSSATTRGRSYNYRVVMVKQGIEMDMRGRCSAGQKVLASIIIRLALADVFSQDCGLIALDEPTTNLDEANITSLAVSLRDLIRERRQQKNFQMIIITHDEGFLRGIDPGQFCDNYYRVSRDRDGNTMVEMQATHTFE